MEVETRREGTSAGRTATSGGRVGHLHARRPPPSGGRCPSSAGRFPPAGSCGGLITTRRHSDAPAEFQDIAPLPDSESLRLLRAWAGTYAGEEDAPGAATLSGCFTPRQLACLAPALRTGRAHWTRGGRKERAGYARQARVSVGYRSQRDAPVV